MKGSEGEIELHRDREEKQRIIGVFKMFEKCFLKTFDLMSYILY